MKSIVSNAKYIRSITNQKLCAMVKSNAYGHGMIQVSQCLEGIVHMFGVARSEEAIELINNGIHNVLLVAPCETKYIRELIEGGVTLTVDSLSFCRIIDRISKSINRIAHVHIGLDCGFGRFGVSDQKTILEMINNFSNISFEGLWSHFGNWDNSEYINDSLQKFNYFRSVCPDLDYHYCSSGGIGNIACQGSIIRTGICLYGYNPFNNQLKSVNNANILDKNTKIDYCKLKPSKEVICAVTNIRKLSYLGRYGYGCMGKLDSDRICGIAHIGYGDGIPRLVNQGYVLCNGTKCNIIGAVAMDSVLIDLSDCINISSIKNAVVINKHTLLDWAEFGNTNIYDILTKVGIRSKFHYVTNDE